MTTIFGMPNLKPPTSTRKRSTRCSALYAEKSIVDYNHNPAATDLDEIAPMAERGIRAFKIYMVVDTGRTYPHPAGTGMHDHGHLLQMMDLIAPTGMPFIIHPHDQALMDYIEGEVLARGDNTPQGYAPAYAARDGVIWDTAIDVLLRLAEARTATSTSRTCRRAARSTRSAAPRRAGSTSPARSTTGRCSSRTWEHVEPLGPYALSYWVPDDAAPPSGRACTTAPST